MLEIATTVGTGAVVLIGVWRLIDARLNSLRQDLTQEIRAVNARIDSMMAAGYRPGMVQTRERRD